MESVYHVCSSVEKTRLGRMSFQCSWFPIEMSSVPTKLNKNTLAFNCWIGLLFACKTLQS